MNVEDIRLYCLNKPGVTESFPFDEDTLVFKVMGKMYALLSLEAPRELKLLPLQRKKFTMSFHPGKKILLPLEIMPDFYTKMKD